MNKADKFAQVILGIAILVVILLLSGALYTIDETQQVVITQFGEPIGEPIKDSGLHFKLPFIQRAHFFDKRILQWDGDPNQIPTKDKKYIFVDTTARWRIVEPLKFMQSVSNEMGALARLDDIIDGATRDFVTSHNLVEAVRDSNRLMQALQKSTREDDDIIPAEALEKIEVGRVALTRGVLERASQIVPQYGIELVDMRIKRINYVEDVRRKVYERMISERKRAAEQYRSEGQGKKAEIEGQTDKELLEIQSLAYKKAQEVMGEADAEAIKIYAEAYNRDPDFYAFLKTLETYQATVDEDATMILTTDSDYFKYLKSIEGIKR